MKILHGNNLDLLKTLPENSVDSIVTDPPYGLSFMNKKWDYDVPSVELWQEVYRVLKHGGHVLSFGGTRTYHRMVVNIEDAGFEIRDQIMWLYGSGFPKSLNIGKSIDKMVGNEDNKQWEGCGTSLKPANEPICLARKPLSEKSITENVLKHGTGGINIDGCRVGSEIIKGQKAGQGFNNVKGFGKNTKIGDEMANQYIGEDVNGRFPANVIHDGSDEVLQGFPKENGSASRFFYCAKASKTDRNDGLKGFEIKRPDNRTDVGMGSFVEKGLQPQANFHPTVKPTELMRYLCRLITPPKGIVLDPFMGSGSTGKGAILEGFDFIGMELDPEYVEIAKARIEYAQKEFKENESQQKLF